MEGVMRIPPLHSFQVMDIEYDKVLDRTLVTIQSAILGPTGLAFPGRVERIFIPVCHALEHIYAVNYPKEDFNDAIRKSGTGSEDGRTRKPVARNPGRNSTSAA